MAISDRGTSIITPISDRDYDGVVAEVGLVQYDIGAGRVYVNLNFGHTEIETTWSLGELDEFIHQLKKARRVLNDG